MQYARNIGRWYNHGVWLAAVGYALEELMLHPVAVPFIFRVGGIVFAGNFRAHIRFNFEARK